MAANLNHLHEPTVLKYESINVLEPPGPVQVYAGIALPFRMDLRGIDREVVM